MDRMNRMQISSRFFGCGGGKQCRLQGFTLFNPAILPVQL